MNTQRGSALITALMMLTLLMILGSALLSSVTLDIAISDNYRTSTQLLYLSELGIDAARRALLESSNNPSELLRRAAGTDGVLSASRDLDVLIGATDDVPFLSGGDRATGRLVSDTSGKAAGRYYVYLRNDAADGGTSLSDTNEVLTLLSVAVIGNARKVLEVSVMKWRFPPLPATLVLEGSPAVFVPGGPGSAVSGLDSSAHGDDRLAIGVRTDADLASVLATIPTAIAYQYPGRGNPSPPPPDAGLIESLLDPRLRTPSGAERIVERILESATDASAPGWNGVTVLGNIGTHTDYRIVVVNGDCELGPGSGFGLLLVRGNLHLTGSFRWDGLILVIGQGGVSRGGAGSGIISGGMFVMRTRAGDRSSDNELGTVLPVSGLTNVDFSGAGTSLQLENPGAAAIALVNQKFPYVPISNREY